MMTNKQHDDAWLNVMCRQVPNGVEYLREINLSLQIRNDLEIINLLKAEADKGKINYDGYYEDLRELSKMAGMKGEWEVNKTAKEMMDDLFKDDMKE